MPPACPCSRSGCFPPPAGCPEGESGAEQHLLARRPGIRQLDLARPRHRGRDGELAPPVSPRGRAPGDAPDAQECSGLGFPGMLWFGIPRDAPVPGRGRRRCLLTPRGWTPQDAAPEAAALGVVQGSEASEEGGAHGGTFLGCWGPGPAREGRSCRGSDAPCPRSALAPQLGPGGVVGQHGPPSPSGVLGGCSASAFPFHPLPVPFQPETWVSLLFRVGFSAAFFYYFNLGAVIIFSII